MRLQACPRWPGADAPLRPLLLTVLACAIALPAQAQRIPVGDPLEDYLRVLSILGRAGPEAFTDRPVAASRVLAGIADTGHPWAGRLPGDGRVLTLRQPTVRIGFSSAVPTGQNDGALWQGKGLTAEFAGGAAAHVGPLEITLWPYVMYTQNGSFPLAPLAPSAQNSPFADPWHRGSTGAQIDLPQRFGNGAFWTLDPSQ